MTLVTRTLATLLLMALAGITLPAGAEETATPADFAGSWQGTLPAGDPQLRLVFHVSESQDGELEATLDSPDQGARGIPVAAVKVDGDSVRFELEVLSATYSGELTDEKRSIAGEWRQSGIVLPLVVERAEVAARVDAH